MGSPDFIAKHFLLLLAALQHRGGANTTTRNEEDRTISYSCAAGPALAAIRISKR
jgi:hypothetical protein